MTEAAPSAGATHVCIYLIRFKDGGEPEFGILHRGSKESCDSVAEMIPAVSYSGDRPVLDCQMGVFEEPSATRSKP